MDTVDFATTVLGIVSILVVGGVIASIKTAVDVAVIKQILKDGQGRMDRIEERIGKHSARIKDLEDRE